MRRIIAIVAMLGSLLGIVAVITAPSAGATDTFVQSACVPDQYWTNHFVNTHATGLKGYGLSWYASVDAKALRKSFDCWTDDLYPYADTQNVVLSTTIDVWRQYLGGWRLCATHTEISTPGGGGHSGDAATKGPGFSIGAPLESQWSMWEQVGLGPCPEANFPDGYTHIHVYAWGSTSYTWMPKHETFPFIAI